MNIRLRSTEYGHTSAPWPRLREKCSLPEPVQAIESRVTGYDPGEPASDTLADLTGITPLQD